jgi:hypothetical protein
VKILDDIKAKREAATQGKRQRREDYDYYMGGMYIGVGPYRYVRDRSIRLGQVRKVDCDISEAQYFHKDICLVVSNNEAADLDYFERMDPRTVEAMENVIRAAMKIIRPDGTIVMPTGNSRNTGIDFARALEALERVDDEP